MEKVDENFLASPNQLCPAVSVVIPMYNDEKYINECLDSVLAQTFQDFEVLVVDDCSTDKSCAVVENYFKNFDGRLKLYHTKENSGGGGYVPRNKGLSFARGEYIFFVDADDFIAENALEILYTSAKKYGADVIYTSTRYFYDETSENINLQRDKFGNELIRSGVEDKIALTVNNPNENLRQLILESGFFHTPWTKFVHREFLIDNEIVFPKIVTFGDSVWTIQVLYHAKNLLRIPNTLYYYRKNQESVTLNKLPAKEQVVHCVSAFLLFAKILKDLAVGIELFEQNPNYFQAAAINAFRNCLKRSFEERNELSSEEIYSVLYRELSKSRDLFESMIPFLFSFIDAEKKIHQNDLQELRKTYEDNLQKYRNIIYGFTGRIDLKLMSTAGDFQIVSVSDEEAKVEKPKWLNKDGIGYLIQSYSGKLELVIKTSVDGKIQLGLRGLDVRSPEDKTKRIPCWIDYNKLIVNGKIIFDKITPAWHDKPYRYDFDIKADEEIKILAEWLPHRADNVDTVSAEVAKIQKDNAEKLRKSEALISELRTALSNEKKVADKQKDLVSELQLALANEKKTADEQKGLVSELQLALDNEKKVHKSDVQLIGKFKEYFTARADIQLATKEKGEFKIISISDDAASIAQPKWFQKNGVGYQIQSCAGKLEFTVKGSVDGQIKLRLRGLDVRSPEDKTKRIPHWINYAKLIINDEIIFNEITPACLEKFYSYSMDVKAGEEVKVQIEWLLPQK
mgnify:CR=1 FL=1